MFRFALLCVFACLLFVTGCANAAKPDLSPLSYSPHPAVKMTLDRDMLDDGTVGATLSVAGHSLTGTCSTLPSPDKPRLGDFAHVIQHAPLFVGYNDDPMKVDFLHLHVAIGIPLANGILELTACDFNGPSIIVGEIGHLPRGELKP